MVIVNFETQECPQSSSDKRVKRNSKRPNQGIYNSALTRVLKNAHHLTRNEVNITTLPDIKNTPAYKRTQYFLRSSYARLKDLKKYLSGTSEYCAHCREYRQFSQGQNHPLGLIKRIFIENVSNSSNSSTEPTKSSKRFSDTFVEKVQNQNKQIENKSEDIVDANNMACCAACKKPRVSFDYYCACEEPSRRVLVSASGRRPPPTRYWVMQKNKKNKSWFCCKKKKNYDWCCCCHQKIKNAPKNCVCVCACPENTSVLQKFKQYINGKRCCSSEMDLSNPCIDERNFKAMNDKLPACNWCSKGYNIAREDSNFEDVPVCKARPQTQRRRASFDKYKASCRNCYSEEEYFDEPDSESDDCCCCCPCRKNFNTCNVQTEELREVYEPKTIDTQTERFASKRRCCKCCRNACNNCTKRMICTDNNMKQKQMPMKIDKHNKRPGGCIRPQIVCSCSSDSSVTNCRQKQKTKVVRCKPEKNKKTKTIICKATGVQHDPSVSGVSTFYPSFTCPGLNTKNVNCSASQRMQNVMFSNVQPTSLFLDTMFTPYNSDQSKVKSFNLNSFQSVNPLKIKMPSTPFLSGYCQSDDDLQPSITAKTKQRFMNAVCDSILTDLNTKRRQLLRNSPDSGYQEPPTAKKASGLSKNIGYDRNLKVTKASSKFSMDHIIKTLKGEDRIDKKDGKEQCSSKHVIQEASKVVRGILEDISSKKNDYSSLIANGSNKEGDDVLTEESLKHIILTMHNNGSNDLQDKEERVEQSRSDSMLLDFESLPGSSKGGACVQNVVGDESYTKLMKAIETIRNKTKKLSK